MCKIFCLHKAPQASEFLSPTAAEAYLNGYLCGFFFLSIWGMSPFYFGSLKGILEDFDLLGFVICENEVVALKLGKRNKWRKGLFHSRGIYMIVYPSVICPSWQVALREANRSADDLKDIVYFSSGLSASNGHALQHR